MKLSWYSDGTQNPWQSWYDSQDKRVRAKHDSVFRFLEDKKNWKRPYAAKLSNCDGLIEIIITTDVAHRLLGFEWIDEFTVVVTCTHKGRQYIPKDAIKTAVRRMNDLKEGRGQFVKHCNKPR